MGIFLITVVFVQILVYLIIFLMKYGFADINGRYEEEFRVFLKNWGFWYFCIPFLPLIKLIKIVRKKTKEILER